MGPMSEALYNAKIERRGQEYRVSIHQEQGDGLRIEVEQESDGSLWRGQFSPSNVEDITAKAGNLKKAAVFNKMLQSALTGKSAAVHVDVLKYSDLESLQAEPGSICTGAQRRTILPSNKRYFILTYTSEYDCTHYPLPLSHIEHPDPRHLKETISRLHAELRLAQMGKESGTELQSQLRDLREENRKLQTQLMEARAVRPPCPDGGPADLQPLEAMQQLQQQCAAQQRRAEAAEAELAQERSAHRRDMRRKNKELAETQEEVVQLKELVRELRMKRREQVQHTDWSWRASSRPPIGARQPFSTRSDIDSASLDGRRHAFGRMASSSMPTSRAHSPGPPLRSASPSTSRASSPRPGTHEHAGHGGSNSRPHSAPPRPPRFDPTHFVREKKERERLAAARLQGGSSMARSPRSSGWPGWTQSHGNGGPNHSRPSSREGKERDTSVGRQRRASITDWGKLRAQLASSENAQPNLRASQGRFLSPAKRATSPGRALQDVKARLSQYAAAQESPAKTASWNRDPNHQVDGFVPLPRAGDPVPCNTIPASTEIAEIDSRLQALQNFLKAAKANCIPQK
ncbi:probable coiled-coil domain-containing protein 61 at N-terminal half [Coccomyxa sp. Obi]|nr:probable coiled-coil domain-containing protein 61 at N-terminal half [Coccomyxa sp. Obi]